MVSTCTVCSSAAPTSTKNWSSSVALTRSQREDLRPWRDADLKLATDGQLLGWLKGGYSINTWRAVQAEAVMRGLL